MGVETADTARRILLVRKDCRAAITESLGRAVANGHRVLDKLFHQPILTVATVRDWLGVTQAGANKLVVRLEQPGIFPEFATPATQPTLPL